MSASEMWSDEVPQVVGSLCLSHKGQVLESSGQLTDDKATAETIFQMLHDANGLISSNSVAVDPFKRMTINYAGGMFAVTVDESKIYVVKRQE